MIPISFWNKRIWIRRGVGLVRLLHEGYPPTTCRIMIVVMLDVSHAECPNRTPGSDPQESQWYEPPKLLVLGQRTHGQDAIFIHVLFNVYIYNMPLNHEDHGIPRCPPQWRKDSVVSPTRLWYWSADGQNFFSPNLPAAAARIFTKDRIHCSILQYLKCECTHVGT